MGTVKIHSDHFCTFPMNTRNVIERLNTKHALDNSCQVSHMFEGKFCATTVLNVFQTNGHLVSVIFGLEISQTRLVCMKSTEN